MRLVCNEGRWKSTLNEINNSYKVNMKIQLDTDTHDLPGLRIFLGLKFFTFLHCRCQRYQLGIETFYILRTNELYKP